MFTNWDSVQFQFDKKNGQLLTTIMHNVFDIKRNFHGWHSTPTDNLAAIFFCSARRYRLSFKQRYQPTNKKKWFFHMPRKAMSTPNDLCLFALRHWMSSAHFFFVVVHLYFSSLVPHIHSTAILLVHWKFVVAVSAWSRTTRHSRNAILSLLLFSDAAKTYTPILLLHFAW